MASKKLYYNTGVIYISPKNHILPPPLFQNNICFPKKVPYRLGGKYIFFPLKVTGRSKI